MTDPADGGRFFVDGIDEFAKGPSVARPFVFPGCARQMTFLATTAFDTCRGASSLAETIPAAELLQSIYEVAATISRRSAKHSAEFLSSAPTVMERLLQLESRGPSANADAGDLIAAAIDLVKAFAEHAGGVAADAWACLPAAIDRLNEQQSLRLMRRANNFLERGGAVALHLLIAGGEILRVLPERFDDWIDLLWTIATHGNAGLVAFIRSSPIFFQTITSTNDKADAAILAHLVMLLTREVGRVDSEAALACLRSSAKALRTVSIEQFENWARAGLVGGEMRARRSYYALETRSSNEALRAGEAGISLESVQHLLKPYVEGLTGRGVGVAALTGLPG